MTNPLEEFKELHKVYCTFDYQTKELASHVGASTMTIQRWMKGKTAPSDVQVKKIEVQHLTSNYQLQKNDQENSIY